VKQFKNINAVCILYLMFNAFFIMSKEHQIFWKCFIYITLHCFIIYFLLRGIKDLDNSVSILIVWSTIIFEAELGTFNLFLMINQDKYYEACSSRNLCILFCSSIFILLLIIYLVKNERRNCKRRNRRPVRMRTL
jgi:hypothetical protein